MNVDHLVPVIHQRNPSGPSPLFGGGLGEPLEVPRVDFEQASLGLSDKVQMAMWVGIPYE
jgi:hypothetical protein